MVSLCLPKDNDIITNVKRTGNVTKLFTDHVLKNLTRRVGTKVQTSISAETFMSRESSSIQVVNEIIRGWVGVSLSSNSFVWHPHINTNANTTMLLGDHNKWRNPGCSTINFLNDALALEIVEFFLNLFSKMEGNSPSWLCYGVTVSSMWIRTSASFSLSIP